MTEIDGRRCVRCLNRSKYEVDSCAVNAALKTAGTKWVLPILLELSVNGAPMRFRELEKTLFPITPKILSSRLRLLEKKGLVSRRVDGGKRGAAVTYALTKKGNGFSRAVMPIIEYYRKFDKESVVCRLLERGAAGGMARVSSG